MMYFYASIQAPSCSILDFSFSLVTFCLHTMELLHGDLSLIPLFEMVSDATIKNSIAL